MKPLAKLSIRCLTWILALGIVLPAATAGEQPAEKLIEKLEPESRVEEKPSVDVVELTVHPATPPRAALGCRLLPSYLDKTYGNAAPLYSKAALLPAPSDAELDDVVKWLKTPVGGLPRERVRNVLSSFDSVYRQLRLASRRTYCDWGLPIWELDNPLEMLLPELQKARNLARLVALKARLEIAEGRFEEAIDTLQTGFTLARHTADQPTLVAGLVGIAIATMMSDQVEALIQSPDAPNLYWALVALPTPLVDLREAFELESVTLYLIFPEFTPAKTRKYTAAQWEAVFNEKEILSRLRALWRGEPGTSAEREREMKATLEKAYPIAKQSLLARGYTQEELDPKPPSQVVVLDVAESFDELRDEMFKWFPIPYWQAHGGMEAAEKRMEAGRSEEVIHLASGLLPAVANCKVAATRMERRIAALRCVEAIRFYAATHDGKLPASLDDVTEVPMPVNPFTGKPFAYRLEGDTAVLEATGGEAKRSQPRQYRVTLAHE